MGPSMPETYASPSRSAVKRRRWNLERSKERANGSRRGAGDTRHDTLRAEQHGLRLARLMNAVTSAADGTDPRDTSVWEALRSA